MVKLFSPEHLYPLAFFLVLGIVSIFFAKRYLNERQTRILGTALALIACTGVVLRMITTYQLGRFNIDQELPIHLCRILGLAAPFIMWSKNRNLLGVLYFATFAGTLNANLTPDVDAAYPELLYFTYWMMHSALLILPIYAIFIYDLRINLKDFKRAFWYINGYFLLITTFNWILNSNYFYTCHKPVSASILDLFGPWPYYVFVTYGIGFLLMVIFYLPWHFRKGPTENPTENQ